MTVEVPYQTFSRSVFERDRPSTPVKAQWELTYRCNLRCAHCYTDPFNNAQDIPRELSLSDCLQILDQLQETGVLWLTLTGGEAVLHPYFREIYGSAKARGFIVTLFSNAASIDDAMADFLALDPPFQLDVSVHGASPRVYEAVTQVAGSFTRFLSGLERLLARRLPVQVKTNALTLNRSSLDGIRALVERYGLQFNLNTIIYPRLNGDVSSTHYRLTPEQIVALEFGEPKNPDESRRLRPRQSVKEGLTSFSTSGLDSRLTAAGNDDSGPSRSSNDPLFRCGCGTSSVTINPYGQMRPCTFTTWPSYNLRTIRLREAFAAMAQTIAGATYAGDSACRQCPVTEYCEKNPVMARVESGSMESAVPHFCEVAYRRQELSV